MYDNMLQRAQKCIDVQGDYLHLFNFLNRVRDLRPRCSTRRRAGFSCAILYKAVQRKSKPLTPQSDRPQPDRPVACVIGLYCVSDIMGSIMCAGLFSRSLHGGPEEMHDFFRIADFLA
jgi:hypothetical protein